MRRLLTISILIVCLLSAFLVADTTPAHATTVQPNSCTYWATDVEVDGSDNGYKWDVAVLSFRACGTGQYLGKLSDQVYMTTPSNPPAYISYWNWGYTNTVPVVHQWQGISPPYPNTTYPSYTGSWSVSAGNNGEACGIAEDATGWVLSSMCAYDNNVH